MWNDELVRTIVLISVFGVWALAIVLFVIYMNWSLKRQSRLEKSRDQADEWLRESFDNMTEVVRESTDKMARIATFLVNHEKRAEDRHKEIMEKLAQLKT